MIHHVKVTEKHIREGKPGKPMCCAIALALAELGLKAEVHTRKVVLSGWISRHISLPPVAVAFVRAFDDLDADSEGNIRPRQTLPEPIEFDLDESAAW